MFRFVIEGSEITPGISIDKEHRILFLMFATYKHRWCFRFRYQACRKKFLFTKTHWTLHDDNVQAVARATEIPWTVVPKEYN